MEASQRPTEATGSLGPASEKPWLTSEKHGLASGSEKPEPAS